MFVGISAKNFPNLIKDKFIYSTTTANLNKINQKKNIPRNVTVKL